MELNESILDGENAICFVVLATLITYRKITQWQKTVWVDELEPLDN